MRETARQLTRIARYLWASPCSLVGLLFALLIVVSGGSVRRKRSVLEVSLSTRRPPASVGNHPFEAITLGHVIIGFNHEGLEQFHLHELEHVTQYEQWGLFFFVAYALSSLWQLLRGRRPYWDNYFERQARERCARRVREPDDVHQRPVHPR